MEVWAWKAALCARPFAPHSVPAGGAGAFCELPASPAVWWAASTALTCMAAQRPNGRKGPALLLNLSISCRGWSWSDKLFTPLQVAEVPLSLLKLIQSGPKWRNLSVFTVQVAYSSPQVQLEGWTRWPPGVPSNPCHSVILSNQVLQCHPTTS